MRKSLLSASLALAMLPLSGCVTDGYGYGYGGIGWSSYPYDVWYDGYYGPIYDGYWGTDGYFWYRPNQGVNRYVRGGHDHFRRDTAPPNGNFRHFEGNVQRPQQGMRAPNLPRGDGPGMGGGRDGGHGGHHRP
jgi:hypothetical protein